MIRDEADLFHAIEYTLNNPPAAGLRDWPWLGCTTELAAILDNECGTGILPVNESTHGQDGRATDYQAQERRSPADSAIPTNLEGLGYGG